MKYYVVSEEELERLVKSVRLSHTYETHGEHVQQTAEAACRARPVEEVLAARCRDVYANGYNGDKEMSEKYYVVSESELEAIYLARTDSKSAHIKGIEAKAACRSRPVPEWATHLVELDKKQFPFFIGRAEEIKK